MIIVNIYHQANINEHKQKEKCALVATLQVENMSLRQDFHKCRDIIISGIRKTDDGDIIEILPFNGYRYCNTGQFEINTKENAY